jgi:putative ABC transport system ATP-binding protein
LSRHDRHTDEVVFMSDGRIVDLMSSPTPGRVLDRMKALGG